MRQSVYAPNSGCCVLTAARYVRGTGHHIIHCPKITFWGRRVAYIANESLFYVIIVNISQWALIQLFPTFIAAPLLHALALKKRVFMTEAIP